MDPARTHHHVATPRMRGDRSSCTAKPNSPIDAFDGNATSRSWMRSSTMGGATFQPSTSRLSPEAVQPVPHALPVGSDREGRAANQNGAPGRDRGFEHGSPLPGSVGAPEGAGAKARSCRRVETERRIEQPPEPDLAGHAPPAATQDRRAIRRPRPTVDENSDLAVTGRAGDVPQRRKPRG